VTITVRDVGAGVTVQDLGRSGHTDWGVGSGGAADRGSLRLANRLVGNPEGAAAFEALLGGLSLNFESSALVAVTGAPAPVLIDGRAGTLDGPQRVPAGSTLTLGAPSTFLRSYLAVRGGLATEVVLGSRSVDEASGLGRALRVGDVVPVGPAPDTPLLVDQAPVRRDAEAVLTAVLGPREDWLTDDAVRRLGASTYVVQPASNRVGTRLDGPVLERRIRRELLSEPTLRGAVEVPADGRPIVFGADHPTTCGYPVVAVLDPSAADRLAQCRPGEGVRFRLRRPSVRLAR
jgi:biotin-dependent carboxylase-like uncharacterized protein